MRLRSAFIAASGLGLLGMAALCVDVPVARWLQAHRVWPPLDKLLQLSEVFGHGLGVIAILITVVVLDRNRRWALPRLACASLGAGIAANLGKLLITRTRPHHFDFVGGVGTTFGDWLPLVSQPSFRQGFPSSHVATAAGMAIGLSWLYPRGRWLFATFAVMVAMQRIDSGAHFVSDTLWGAAIGVAIGGWMTNTKSLGWLGNRCERWLASRRGANPS